MLNINMAFFFIFIASFVKVLIIYLFLIFINIVLYVLLNCPLILKNTDDYIQCIAVEVAITLFIYVGYFSNTQSHIFLLILKLLLKCREESCYIFGHKKSTFYSDAGSLFEIQLNHSIKELIYS